MKTGVGNQQGFTLAELMVALTIFAIGMIGVAGMQMVAIRTNATANTLTAATAVTQGVLDDLLSQPFANFSTSRANVIYDFDPAIIGDQPIIIPSGGVYSATYDIVANYNGVANIALVTVNVTGAGRTVSLIGFKRML
jgi:type IV pilus assembly protein PilV